MPATDAIELTGRNGSEGGLQRVTAAEILTAEVPGFAGDRERRWALRTALIGFSPFLRIEGAERVPDMPEPAVWALNHNNSFETVAVPALLTYFRGGRVVRFLADWMFMHIPVIGRVIRMTEPIPVYTKPAFMRVGESYRLRQTGFRPVDACCAALQRGESVGIFPEGTRNHSMTLRRGRRGLGFVVLRTKAPVVPVGIRFPAAQEYGHVPKIGRMEVRVGEPLWFDAECQQLSRAAGIDSEAAGELAQKIVDRVMVTLSRLCAKPYPVEGHRETGAEGGTDGLSSD